MSWDVLASLEQNSRQGIAELAAEVPETVAAIRLATALHQASVAGA